MGSVHIYYRALEHIGQWLEIYHKTHIINN